MSTGTGQAGSDPAGTAQRLKAQIDNYPVRLRPGLARDAFRAHRRHRALRRSIAAAGVAIVIAAGAAFLAAGTVPFSSAPGGRPPISPAVISPQGVLPPASLQPTPPGNDLTATQAASDILWTRTTVVMLADSATSVQDVFRYRGAWNEIYYQPDGKPFLVTQSAQAAGPAGTSSVTTTQVNYELRTWERSTGPRPPAAATSQSPCATAANSSLIDTGYESNLALARALVNCPGLTISRGHQIDGIDAITITDKTHATLWLNATTYLPIRLVPPSSLGEMTIQYGYLPPTAANLGYLSGAIPRGFRHISAPGNPPATSGSAAQVWVPPAGVIPPFGLQPVPASDSLTAQQAAGDIEWTRLTTNAIPASDTVTDSTFSYKSASRDLTYYPDGKPWDDDETYVKRGPDGKPASVHTIVLYDRKTVSVQTSPDAMASAQPPQQQDVCTIAQTTGLANINYPLTPAQAHALLSCQGQAVTRGLTFDGINAIKITSSHDGETLWMNAATSLPIEIVIVNAKGSYPPAGYNSAPSPGEVIQFTWLPPTPANLAYVGIPIPPGFTKTG
jgi:hypothetical protein